MAEISIEIMRCLRTEEKRVYREIVASQNRGSTLSLDVSHDEEKEYWLEDNGMGVSEMEIPILEEEFCKLLTANQLEIYKACMIGHCSVREYARRKKLDPKTVSEVIAAIRKKFKKFFWDTPTNA